MADPVNSFPNTQIARAAAGLYDLQLGEATMTQALAAATQSSVGSVVNAVFNNDFASLTDAQVAAIIAKNIGITADAGFTATQISGVESLVAQILGSAAPGTKGATVVAMLDAFAQLGEDPVWGDAATAFNNQIQAATGWASLDGSDDTYVHTPPSMAGRNFNLAGDTAAGADVMRLTGDQDVRIDFTNPANQVVGLDLDGDGLIEFNGSERSVTGRAADFEIVDAYPRSPLDHTNIASNFLGDIWFDGEGFNGDGVSTNGNIFLGGLGADTALGGNGNDFLAGGGVAQDNPFSDTLYGGRNADFFFAQFAPIDLVDGGVTLSIDGGSTADNNSAANTESSQDRDWLLLEATDDQEPITVVLGEDAFPFDAPIEVAARTGEQMHLEDVENLDASGNLYGFLDDVDVEIGDRAIDDRDASTASVGYNYAYGTSAQLIVSGSGVANIIVGGYDNDRINGEAGNDTLFGGNLDFLHNPNLAAIWNNGRDELVGGDGSDNIVFETDGGVYEGGDAENADDVSTDTLWLTDDAFGRRTVNDVTTDGTARIDLAVGKTGGLANASGYGGADRAAATGNFTSDQTNYKTGYSRAQVQDFENVIATGLGAIDYLAAGTNSPELVFTNQQNHYWFAGNLDLRGTTGVNTLYASVGNDDLEGRAGGTSTFNSAGTMTGDNRDKLSGGAGSDDFFFAHGDGVDVIHRQTNLDIDGDGDADNLTDGTFGVDFGEEGPRVSSDSTLTLTLPTGATINVAGISFLLDGTTYTVDGLASDTFAGFTAALNTALDADAALAALEAVLNADNTVTITDPDGGIFAKNPAGGWLVTGSLPPDGTSSWRQDIGDPNIAQDQDRLIYVAYEDRADGERVDDQSTTGSSISLGTDAYAEDLVIDFKAGANGKVSTSIAEDQRYVLTFSNLTTEDTVTITVNGVQYQLQVGVDLDGNEIGNEELATQGGTAASQATIQQNFLNRMITFINSFMDDDTASGELAADSTDAGATTIRLVQADYNGEETVFMRTPTVQLGNGSGGEPATVTVSNLSDHEVELFEFDGRNGELNDTNVLFWGDQQKSRAILETGAGAAGTSNVIDGSDAMIIDGGANTLQSVIYGTGTSIADNTATNAFLRTDFTVHGDDLLLGGAANDTINAGTGDDRVIGSLGVDSSDGGRSYYAVQVLGEPQARVYLLNEWEARNPGQVTALSTLTISSINRIGDSESGNATPVSTGLAEVYNDTLQFQQADFSAGTTFTVHLNNFAGSTPSTLQFRSGGAGQVTVDNAGDGVIDGTTTFTNYENIRTVSGTGLAVANGGQGNDTLNVPELSAVAGGVAYDLTNRADAANPIGAGKVTYSANAHASATRPVDTDFETLVIKVDGVENVITDNAAVISGDDLLMIDETEAAKHNRFTAGEGDDRIEYLNDFVTAVDGAAEPQVTIKVDTIAAATGGTDTVTMTSGRVGTTVAVDSLDSVEYITLAGNTAEGQALGGVDRTDVVDVTALTSGATVNYIDGTIKSGGVLHVTIEGIVEIERVNADGNDVVVVADAAVMSTNARSDEFNDEDADGALNNENTNILFMTYRDFDDLNAGATTRKSFSAQVGDDTVQNVINQGQFQFSLSEVGTDTDVDRVDYSAELGRIVVPVGQGNWTVPGAATNKPQYVVVDGDNDQVFWDAESRVDQLWSVEEVVAARGVSVMDFTDVGQARQITFKYVAPSSNPADKQVVEQAIRIADGNGNTISGLNAFIEKYTYDSPTSLLPAVADATWNQIEGSDAGEVVIYEGSEDLVNQSGIDHRFTTDTLTLRGGNNEVRYSPLETSITLALDVVEEDAATTTVAEGRITGLVSFQDGKGQNTPSLTYLGGQHLVTSNTSDNSTSAGSLKVEGSQDAEDLVGFTSVSNKTFILGTSPGVINVNIGSLNTIVLTGFEFLLDAATSDVYDIRSISSIAGLRLADTAGDHDTIRVGDEAINYNNAGVNTIDLDNINSSVGGFNFDFHALDIARVTKDKLVINGGSNVADNDDELVMGVLGNITAINDFEGLVMTDGSVVAGNTFTFKPGVSGTPGYLKQGNTNIPLTSTAGGGSVDTLSFGGLALHDQYAKNGGVASVNAAVSVTVEGAVGAEVYGGNGNDTLTGAGGADRLGGGAGNDILDGGFSTETRQIQVGGALDATAGSTITLTFAGAGVYTTTLTEGSAQLVAGAGGDAVGAALAAQITANLTALNTATQWNGGASLRSVAYSDTTDQLVFTFSPGVNVTGTIAITDDDASTSFFISAETTVTQGSDGSSDTFVFAATGAGNGVDTINNFVAAGQATDDVLEFNAFLGGAASAAAAAADFAAAGLSTLGATNYGVVYNKGGLASSDIALAAAAGKIAVEDNGKAVIVVTGDVDGAADTTVNPYLVYYVEDTNKSTTAQTYTVTQVATINSQVERSAAEMATATEPAPVVVTPTADASVAATVDEGATATFTLTTTNVANGTVFNYVLSGAAATAADTSTATTGTVTVNNNTATLPVVLLADLTTEGAEALTATFSSVGLPTASATVTVLDTSVTPAGGPVFTSVPIAAGTTALTATAANEAFVFEFKMVNGRATKVDGEVTITGFDVTKDKLVFEDTGTGSVLTEAQFMTLAGVSIAQNPFANNTTIYFDADGGVAGGVTLLGILDDTLSTIVVETLA